MMRAKADFANLVIERILELSADAQIDRRRTAKDSPEFHHLNGVIAAYGKALALLTAVQRREEFHAIVGEPGGFDVADSVSASMYQVEDVSNYVA